MRPDSGTGVGEGMGVGVGVGTGVGLGVAVGAGVGVGMGVGPGVGVGIDEVGIDVGVGEGAGVEVGAGRGDGVGVGSGEPRSSSIALEMSSKEGEPSYLTPVVVGSLERTNMVGVTETWFWRARLMSLWTTLSYFRVSIQEENWPMSRLRS